MCNSIRSLRGQQGICCVTWDIFSYGYVKWLNPPKLQTQRCQQLWYMHHCCPRRGPFPVLTPRSCSLSIVSQERAKDGRCVGGDTAGGARVICVSTASPTSCSGRFERKAAGWREKACSSARKCISQLGMVTLGSYHGQACSQCSELWTS